MSQECELLSKCGFFNKYKETKSAACNGLIRLYCKGEKMNECKRKEYRLKNGTPPSDDMYPNGSMVR